MITLAMSEFDRLSQTRNHFELFGLPVRFALDRQFLHSRYLQLTRATHPDMVGADPEKQIAAIELSARVNDAFATLSDDLKRAEYILQLRGSSLADVRLAPDTLEKIFELREEMETAQTVGDDEGVQSARKMAAGWLSDVTSQIGEKLDAGDDVTQLAQLVSTARYLRKICEA